MGRVILHNNYVEIINPLIFLAGPIHCAPRWQDKAVEILFSLNEDLDIASPSWYLKEAYQKGNKPKPRGKSQVPWETFHLRKAGTEKGAILFWLAEAAGHDCSYGYARTTRGELGEWLTRANICGDYIALGIERGFEGADYWRWRIVSRDFGDQNISETLEDTCREALRMIAKRLPQT